MCVKLGHCVVFLSILHIRHGEVLLTHFMLRCGSKLTALEKALQPSPQESPHEIRQVCEQILNLYTALCSQNNSLYSTHSVFHKDNSSVMISIVQLLSYKESLAEVSDGK